MGLSPEKTKRERLNKSEIKEIGSSNSQLLNAEETFIPLDTKGIPQENFINLKLNKKGTYNKNWFNEMNKDNKYFKFIESCKIKKPEKNLKGYQIHHIVPKYMFRNKENPLEYIFQESSLNLISLSVADHTSPSPFPVPIPLWGRGMGTGNGDSPFTFTCYLWQLARQGGC